jgi:hypothetical protein
MLVSAIYAPYRIPHIRGFKRSMLSCKLAVTLHFANNICVSLRTNLPCRLTVKKVSVPAIGCVAIKFPSFG